MDRHQRASIGSQSTLTLDRSVCCGTAACVETAPDLLQISDEDGLACLIRAKIDERSLDLAAAAADACPTLALKLETHHPVGTSEAEQRGAEPG
jgi:ferredoxin